MSRDSVAGPPTTYSEGDSGDEDPKTLHPVQRTSATDRTIGETAPLPAGADVKDFTRAP